jgi:uncharacterized FlaG/YvyC family protein
MQAASQDTIKAELKQLPPKQVLDLLLRLSRFKKENKELLSYLLFEAGDEQGYVQQVKAEVDEQFIQLKETGFYLYKKQIRKIQRLINKPVKYMGSKTSTAELYLHMANKIQEQKKTIYNRGFLEKIVQQYISKINRLLPSIDDDLQHDISQQLRKLIG